MKTKPVTCPRCHGPATMIDKAPKGERGDVIRCDVEEECATAEQAAKDLENAHSAVCDAALTFTSAIGRIRDNAIGTVSVPVYHLLDFQDAVDEWKKAGQALHDATGKMASARAKVA